MVIRQADQVESHTSSERKPRVVEQRLRTLFELAVTIGRREGLLGDHKSPRVVDTEGGLHVADKGNI
jgi:hypothetical protein